MSLPSISFRTIWVANYWAPVHPHKNDRPSVSSGSSVIGAFSSVAFAKLGAATWLWHSWFYGRMKQLSPRQKRWARAFRKHVDKGVGEAAIEEWKALMKDITDDENYNQIRIDEHIIDMRLMRIVNKYHPFKEPHHEPVVAP